LIRVKLTVFITNAQDVALFRETRDQMLNGHLCASTLLVVSAREPGLDGGDRGGGGGLRLPIAQRHSERATNARSGRRGRGPAARPGDGAPSGYFSPPPSSMRMASASLPSDWR
jgi:hypothetical protein